MFTIFGTSCRTKIYFNSTAVQTHTIATMKTLICLYIFSISLQYVLLSNVTTTEITIENQVHNSVEDNEVCTCSKSHCVCCKYLNWKLIYVNGLTCVNAKYMEDSVGVDLSVTYNNTVIIQENLSLEKPLCIKNNMFGILPGSLCVQANDVILTSKNFHACFQITGRWFSIDLLTVNLGCINITKNTINNHYVGNVIHSLIDVHKRKTNNVIL